MRKELQSMIDSFDYDKALKWYLTHVEGKFFIKNMLKKGPDRFNVLKLKKELHEILAGLPTEPAPAVAKPTPKPKLDTIKQKQLAKLREDVEQTRDELMEEIESLKEQLASKPKVKLVERAADSKEELLLDEEWKSLYRRANHLFEQINHVPDQATRKGMAFKILDLMDEVEDMWWKKDYIKAHGKMPDFADKGADQLTVEQLATRIRTLRTYISKAKKGMLNADKIPGWEVEIADLERRLRS